MPVPSSMSDLSTTASSNSPAGSENPATTDDYHRAIQAIVRSTNAKGTDIASAGTIDLGAATGEFVDVTGTTTITSLGTVSAGIVRTVRFTGALTLTHNATSLILPTGANITTAANDVAIFRSLGSGNWLCVSYLKADGSALSQTAYAAINGSASEEFAVADDPYDSDWDGNTGAARKDNIYDKIESLSFDIGEHMVRLNTANGHGSTNTKIRRFANIVTNQGSDITYADSSTLGASFTVNAKGIYTISYSDMFNAAIVFGLSLNSSQLTTNFTSIDVGDVLISETTDTANRTRAMAWTGFLEIGDVVRAHTTGAATGSSVTQVQFTMVRVA